MVLATETKAASRRAWPKELQTGRLQGLPRAEFLRVAPPVCEAERVAQLVRVLRQSLRQTHR
eukprot:11155500-Lingulodinium_polyedra.AAC.1